MKRPPTKLDIKLEQMADKLPYQFFNLSYLFFIIVSFCSFAFGVLLVEETITGYYYGDSFLTILGLDMDLTKLHEEKFFWNSILEIVATFGFGYMGLFPAASLRNYYLKRRKNHVL